MADLILGSISRGDHRGVLIVRYTLTDNPTNAVLKYSIIEKIEHTRPYQGNASLRLSTGRITLTLPSGSSILTASTETYASEITKEFIALAERSVTINKTKTVQTVSFAPHGDLILDGGSYLNLDGTFSISIPALDSYQIAYNANGGADAPASQTKWYNESLTLQAGKPTREGYGFTKWNTAADGSGTDYDPSGIYTANAAATLYAQWQTNSKITIYDENGNPHTGFLKLYDDEGKLHDCIITLYDSQGNKKHIQ